MRKITRIFLYSFYVLLITFVLLEILVRIWGYSRMYFYDPIYMPYSKSAEIPYVMKPNLHHVRAHGMIWINTDSLGLRSAVPGQTYGPKQANEYRIAFVGDSVTFGVGVKTNATYPEVVGKLLNHLQSHCKVTVFNFGVSSYSVKEMVATLKYRVPEINPDLVVMGIVIDDFDTGRTPQVDKWGYNTHGGASKLINRFPTVKLILRKIHLSYLIRDILTRTFMSKKIEYESINGKPPAIVAHTFKYLEEFKKIAEKDGYKYVIVTLPSVEGNGNQFTYVIHKMKADHITYFDTSFITPLFTFKQFHASEYDWHPSAAVHHKIAAMLSDYILNNFLKTACAHKLSPQTSQPTPAGLPEPAPHPRALVR